jgi:large subunit ribosomal protein L24
MARLPKSAKGDLVVLLRGSQKGKSGIVRMVFPKTRTALVEGLNVVKRHTKQGQAGAKSSGIIEKEAQIPLCALMLLDPKLNVPTKIRRARNPDGTSIRIAVRSGEMLQHPAKAGA